MMHGQLNRSLSNHSHINLKTIILQEEMVRTSIVIVANHQQGELSRRMDPTKEETFSVVINLEMSTVDTLNGLMRLTLVPAMDFSKLEVVEMPGVNVFGEELLVNVV